MKREETTESLLLRTPAVPQHIHRVCAEYFCTVCVHVWGVLFCYIFKSKLYFLAK